jgi:hypothetical protein
MHNSPPVTLPLAARHISNEQSKFSRSLKSIQYLLSAIIHPLDVLRFSIAEENNDATMHRYLKMLADCRALLNASTEITNLRNDLAFKVVNPSYSNSTSAFNAVYTMDPAVFQASLSQQTTTAQAFRQARP